MIALQKSVGYEDKSRTRPKNRGHSIDMSPPLPIGLALAAALRNMPQPGRAIVAPIARDLERRR